MVTAGSAAMGALVLGAALAADAATMTTTTSAFVGNSPPRVVASRSLVSSSICSSSPRPLSLTLLRATTAEPPLNEVVNGESPSSSQPPPPSQLSQESLEDASYQASYTSSSTAEILGSNAYSLVDRFARFLTLTAADKARKNSNGGKAGVNNGGINNNFGSAEDEYAFEPQESRLTKLAAALRTNRGANTISVLDNEKSSSSPSSSPSSSSLQSKLTTSSKDDTIQKALSTLEKDMSLLDNLAGQQPQLTVAEALLLAGAVFASGIGPIAFPGTSVAEVLAPAAAAFCASITIGSEYVGRVAVADGKEIAANTIQCAAEAESLLAKAERVKAITPLCVGVGATAASFALLVPVVIEGARTVFSVQMVTLLYLLCPLVSVLAASVCNLALEEARAYGNQAINVGVRRFSKSGLVGRTWLSATEQILQSSKGQTDRWWSFAGSVLPAPIIGGIVGDSLSTKCIIVAALGALQSAYFLALAESALARATDAVAIKARSAAVADTYANQGSRNSAILPFTSALSAFCAAATAATVELPLVHSVSAAYGVMGEVALISFFPTLSSAFAAAAAVSKARCEVDAEAASQAASTLALEYDGMKKDDDPVLRPLMAVWELLRLAFQSGLRSASRVGLGSPVRAGAAVRKFLLGLRWTTRKRPGPGEADRWAEA